MLECRSLAVAYGRHQALKQVNLHVAPGEVVVILGANGAGKTTLLKAVAGLLSAAPGSQVRLEGHNITALPPHRIVEAGLALVPEGRGVFADLTVRENLLLGAFAQRARAQQQTQLDRVLSLFPKLAERSAQQVRTMSGGEQQMVAIGRALMSSPLILMLDEPSLGLSPLLCTELFKALVEVRKSGVGILLVEQNARQSLAIADRAYLLENGEVVGEGPAAQLAGDPAVQAAYLGGAASSGAAPGRVPARAATAAQQTPPPAFAALAAQSAVRPAAPSTRSTPAEALIPTRIADLVKNAALVQAAHVASQRLGTPPHVASQRVDTPAHVANHRRPSASSHSGAPAAGANPNLLAGQTVAEALARIAAAAARARQPAAANQNAHQPPRPSPVQNAGDKLSGIEADRRPLVEVYRRANDGSLRKED